MRLKPRYPGQHLRAFASDSLGFITAAARDHGDVVEWRLGAERFAMLSHPDDVRDVLVTNARVFRKGRGLERAKMLLGEGLLTSEGEFHLRQRRLAQPAFHRQRIAGYGETMTRYAAQTRDAWRAGQTLDVADEMMRLTLAVVGQTLFGADVEGEAPEIGQALTEAFHSFSFAVLPFGELLQRVPFLPPVRRFNRARARLDATIYRIIAEHRAAGRDQGDLLSMLIGAEDADDAGSGAGDGGTPDAVGRRMSDLQLRDEAMTIFLAGHETTANALTWTWYLLSEHPDVEARMHAEIDAALGGRVPGAGDLALLPYTRMVLAESMRLYPPAWVIGRRNVEPYTVRGVTLPARTVVLLSQYVVHRDPRWWPEPERFRPERWAEDPGDRPKFAYFPFGAGTRVCIGEQFAWMEGTLLLATIAQRWRLRLAPGHPVAMQAIITLRPRHGMRMVVEERQRAAASG
jgi:cytochrome P450